MTEIEKFYVKGMIQGSVHLVIDMLDGLRVLVNWQNHNLFKSVERIFRNDHLMVRFLGHHVQGLLPVWV